MDYKNGMNFSELRAGSIIRNVPLDNDIFWTAINRPRNSAWIERRDEITEFQPVYFCKNCRQIEDGAHRIAKLYKDDAPGCDVKIYSKCIHKNLGYLGILEASLEYLKAKNPDGFHKLDNAWLNACRDKWLLFRDIVDFRGKTVLDIGTQVGYTPLEAARHGAESAVGFDVRQSVINVGNFARDKLGFDFKKVDFERTDWKEVMAETGGFDIVTCFGLLHYFPIGEYEGLFQKILETAKETVILELRTRPGEGLDPILIKAGNQTIPTESWIIKKIFENGFELIKRFIRKPGRELLVANRK